MVPEVKYERKGKFIYGACRKGGDIADVYSWMADELGMPHPSERDEAAQASLQAEYFAKYLSDEQFSESHQRFMRMRENTRNLEFTETSSPFIRERPRPAVALRKVER